MNQGERLKTIRMVHRAHISGVPTGMDSGAGQLSPNRGLSPNQDVLNFAGCRLFQWDSKKTKGSLTEHPLLKIEFVLLQLICIRKNPVSLCDLAIHRETVLYQRGTSPPYTCTNSAPPFDLFQFFLLFHLTIQPFQAPQQPPSGSSQRQPRTPRYQILLGYGLPCCTSSCFLWASSSSA